MDANAVLIVMLAITATALGFALYVDIIGDPIANFLAWVALGLTASMAVSLFVRAMP